MFYIHRGNRSSFTESAMLHHQHDWLCWSCFSSNLERTNQTLTLLKGLLLAATLVPGYGKERVWWGVFSWLQIINVPLHSTQRTFKVRHLNWKYLKESLFYFLRIETACSFSISCWLMLTNVSNHLVRLGRYGCMIVCRLCNPFLVQLLCYVQHFAIFSG